MKLVHVAREPFLTRTTLNEKQHNFVTVAKRDSCSVGAGNLRREYYLVDVYYALILDFIFILLDFLTNLSN